MIRVSGQVVEAVTDCKVVREINGSFVVSFSAVYTTLNKSLVVPGAVMELEGQVFDIFETDISRNDVVMVSAYAEHVSYRLNRVAVGEFPDAFLDVRDALEALLTGTMFSIGTVDFAGPLEYKADPKATKRTVLFDIAAMCGAEVEFDNASIHFRQKLGRSVGRSISSGKNIVSVQKKEAEQGEAYEVSFAELSTLGVAGEEVLLGDTISLVDDELGINVNARVVAYEYNPLEKHVSKVSLNSKFSTLSDKFVGIRQETKEMIDEAFENIDPEVIENAITNNVVVNNLYAKRGRIAELTVDSLVTGDFLTGDEQIFYIEIREQYCRYMQAARTEEMVQYKSYDNELLYWKDATKKDMTTKETEFPVMVYVYDAIAVMEMCFEEVADDVGPIRVPVIRLGRGDGATITSSKGRIYKGRKGVVVEYFKSNTGDRLAMELTDEGVRFAGYSTIFTGTAEPTENLGKDGDIYVKF